jgi:uncharacterized protein (DUF486 family)
MGQQHAPVAARRHRSKVARMTTVLLLFASNVFMTVAWYWHLLARDWPMWSFILVSWLIALPEYCLAVPANRLGHIAHGGVFTAPQLKVLQEGIALLVFLAFSIAVLKEVPRWSDLAGMGLIVAGLCVALFAPR